MHFIESGPHLMLLPRDPSSLDTQTTDFDTGAPYVMFKDTIRSLMIDRRLL